MPSWEFSFCFFISYAYICTCIRRHLKEAIPSSSITWSEMGKQNKKAKEVYCNPELIHSWNSYPEENNSINFAPNWWRNWLKTLETTSFLCLFERVSWLREPDSRFPRQSIKIRFRTTTVATTTKISTSFRFSLMLAFVWASNRCSVVMSTPARLTSLANLRARSSLCESLVVIVDTRDHLYLWTSLASAWLWKTSDAQVRKKFG